jgi:hypothetical protein
MEKKKKRKKKKEEEDEKKEYIRAFAHPRAKQPFSNCLVGGCKIALYTIS